VILSELMRTPSPHIASTLASYCWHGRSPPTVKLVLSVEPCSSPWWWTLKEEMDDVFLTSQIRVYLSGPNDD